MDEDQLEIQTNKVRSAISELVNISVFSLKEAFESQRKLRAKIAEFEKIGKSLHELKGVPGFEEGEKELQKLKNRIKSCSNRILVLEKRLSDIEKATEQQPN